MTAYFITATGTDSGKTYITTALCKALRERGQQVFALKPVISGWVEDGARNDTLRIIEALGLTPDAIDTISPWRFQAPLAAPMAAAKEGKTMAFEEVAAYCRTALEQQSGMVVIEGAGGVMSPLSDTTTFLDLMVELKCPVILVANTYLGAISHCLTALACLEQQGCVVKVVVVNEVVLGDVSVEDTAQALRAYTAVPVVTIAHNGSLGNLLDHL